MCFLQGFVHAKRKFTNPKYKIISEMYIDRLDNMILEDEHLLTDSKGNIQVFNCELGDKQFKGIVKYKTGDKKMNFLLSEDVLDYRMILGDKKYSIKKIPGENGVVKVVFEGDELKCYESNNEEVKDDRNNINDENSVDEEVNDERNKMNDNDETKDDESNMTKKVNDDDNIMNDKNNVNEIILIDNHLKNESLINFIKSNLNNISSPLPSLKCFSISHVDKTYGFIYSYHKDHFLHYTVLLLSEFYNPIELFPVIPKIKNVPFFKNNCFLIAEGIKEIYLSCRISLNFDFTQNFLNKVTGSLLCEDRIVFTSKKDILLKIKYLLRTIRPFRWSHSLIVSDHLTEDLLDSPLPFIVGIPELVNFEDKITYVDLDKQTVKNNRMTIVAKKDLSLRLANYINSKKKFILEENLNNIQNVLLYSYRYFRDFGSISILPEDEEYDYELIRRFTSTRMFTRYITEERIGTINYIYDIESGRLECLPYQDIEKVNLIDVLKIYTEIYDLENSFITKKIYEYAESNNFLNELAPSLFRRFSISEDYEGIRKLFRKVKVKEISKINIYERQNILKIEEEDFENLKIVKEKDSTMIIKGDVSYNLYPLESLFYIFTQQKDLKVKYPEVFYNLVGYFFYFNLPFSYEEFDYKVRL